MRALLPRRPSCTRTKRPSRAVLGVLLRVNRGGRHRSAARCSFPWRLLHKGLSEAVKTIPGWRRTSSRDREQELLLPPSLREWLPEDHLAWFVLDAVDAM